MKSLEESLQTGYQRMMVSIQYPLCLFCLHVSGFSMGQVTSGNWSPGYYFNVF